MAMEFAFDPTSFKGVEYAAWQRGATSYDQLFGSITRLAMEPMLDATDVRGGSRVLEVCCGLGYGVGAALGRNAEAWGIDIAPAMIEIARVRYPAASFSQGDAEPLDFGGTTFDAVICSFGLNHLPNPEGALAEARRVLRPGGKFAFTLWCPPGKSKFHELVQDSVRAHGKLDVPLPVVQPRFRFGEPEACAAALVEAGFSNPEVEEIGLCFRTRVPEQLVALTNSAPRLELMLSLQTPEARERIHRAIAEGAERFRVGETIEIPIPAVLASGVKPA